MTKPMKSGEKKGKKRSNWLIKGGGKIGACLFRTRRGGGGRRGAQTRRRSTGISEAKKRIWQEGVPGRKENVFGS